MLHEGFETVPVKDVPEITPGSLVFIEKPCFIGLSKEGKIVCVATAGVTSLPLRRKRKATASNGEDKKPRQKRGMGSHPLETQAAEQSVETA